MDLFVVATPLSNRNRLALWKMGGVKVWDVEVGRGDAAQESIVGVSWSPDGLQIAVIHEPPRLTFHSCHDGREIRSLETSVGNDRKLRGVWWFQHESSQSSESGRSREVLYGGKFITGSAQSILRLLPPLESKQESRSSSTARVLSLKAAKDIILSQHEELDGLPELAAFPTLPSDLDAAPASSDIPYARQSNSSDDTQRIGNRSDNCGIGTLVVVADDSGHLLPFLEGSYPLGVINLGQDCSVVSVWKSPNKPIILVHITQFLTDQLSRCTIFPTTVHISLLSSASVLDVARISSITRSLVLYVNRTFREMSRAWYGHQSTEGGREVGMKWIKVLQEKEKQLDGSKRTNPIFELTNLLFTGKTSSAMREFLGGSGKLSERGMAQWQSTVANALNLIQDSAERKLSPAFERLVVVLEEVRGWTIWPQAYAAFQFTTEDIELCLKLCHRGIELAEWLSKEATAECQRFIEFMSWIKAESSRVNDGVVSDMRAPTYDPLEVSEYLEHGLLNSSIDQWFTGTTPKHDSCLVQAEHSTNMGDLMTEIRSIITRSTDLDSSGGLLLPSTRNQSTYPDRASSSLRTANPNLQALIEELSLLCCKIFQQASGAVGSQAVVETGPFTAENNSGNVHPDVQTGFDDWLMCDRFLTVEEVGQEPRIVHFTAMAACSSQEWKLVIIRKEYNMAQSFVHPKVVEVSVFDHGPLFENAASLEVLDLDFFDDNTLLAITRCMDRKDSGEPQGHPYLISIDYSRAQYTGLPVGENMPKNLEELIQKLMQLCVGGMFPTQTLPITRSRELKCCTIGKKATLAVNGRENRRCACVLDGEGRHAEIFDIDAEGDDEDGEEENQPSDHGDHSKEDLMEE
ncbi:hypothetical protein FRC03_001163 [Tulasnella sp. 419]|nr:hypothetical protein FRC03_001163 [Tulasnella sp. 419]